MTDLNDISAPEFGRGLRGIGLNLLVRDVKNQVRFLVDVFDMVAFQVTTDFAIITCGNQVFQLHADAAYHANPYLALLPEFGARGAGIEIRLYDLDPDMAVARVKNFPDATILQAPTNKPHGLYEAYILCENGYCWVPSRPASDQVG